MSVYKQFIGKSVFIRTVTNHFTGRIDTLFDDGIILEDASWIADSGRWADALATGKLAEVEPYPNGARVVVSLAAIVDMSEWTHPLPRTQK